MAGALATASRARAKGFGDAKPRPLGSGQPIYVASAECSTLILVSGVNAHQYPKENLCVSVGISSTGSKDMTTYQRMPFIYWRFEWNLNLIAACHQYVLVLVYGRIEETTNS